MPQAFFHREQDIGVAACLDMNDAVGVQTGEIERGCEQVAPAQAPEDRALDPRENACQKHRRRRIVAKLGASGQLVERAGRDTAAWQLAIKRGNPERHGRVPLPDALDGGDARTQIGDDSWLPHRYPRLGND